MGKVKINWLEAYQDYLVTKEMSLRDVAEKYGISLSRVKKVSMIRKWTITKNRVWEAARETAINETIDSAEELIIRHSEATRYLQETGLRLLKEYLRKTKVTEINPYFLLRMIVLGLKIERELYPDSLRQEHQNTATSTEGHSEALTEAIYEVFREKLIGRKRRNNKTPSISN